jgi:hypothetical protein
VATAVSSDEPAKKVDRNELHRVFNQLDLNKDQKLSLDELEQAMESLGMPLYNVQEMFDEADVDGNNAIDFDEYCDIVEKSGSWEAIHKKSASEQLSEVLTAAQRVLRPIHDAIRRKHSVRCNIGVMSGGFRAPSGYLRALLHLIDLCFILPALPLRYFLWRNGHANLGHWVGNLIIVRDDGTQVGHEYMFVRMILSTFLLVISMGVGYVFDAVFVCVMEKRTLADMILGGNVVCKPLGFDVKKEDSANVKARGGEAEGS